MYTAAQHIARKESQTLYKRTPNGRYIPVSDPYAYDGLREGSYLVVVRPGSTSIRQAVYPARAEIQAALLELEDELTTLISKAAEARPRKMPLTPKEKAAWEELVRVGGDSFSTLTYESINGIARALTDRIDEKLRDKARAENRA